MKLTILLAAFGLGSLTVSGQGFGTFGNNYGAITWEAPIYGPEPSNLTLSITGQSSLGVPSGTTVYTGARLFGTGWDMAFYAGPTTATSYTEMSLITTVNFQTQTAGPPPGFVNGTTAQVPGVAVGNPANYEAFVWDNLGGTVNDLPTALTDWEDGVIPLGSTPVLTLSELGGGVILPPNTEFPSFNVYYVPEPGALALAGLGVAGLLLMRRREGCGARGRKGRDEQRNRSVFRDPTVIREDHH